MPNRQVIAGSFLEAFVKPPRPLNDEEIATLNKLVNEYVTYSDPTPNSPQPLCEKAVKVVEEVLEKKEKG